MKRTTVHPTTLLLALVATLGGQARAADLPPDMLREVLRRPIGVTWGDNRLWEGLQELADRQQTAIFLDRRIDPDLRISVAVDDEPFSDVLRQIALSRRLGVGSVGPVIYVGPPRVASTIATVAALRRRDALDLPPQLRDPLMRRREIAWPELSRPRWLITKTVAEFGWQLSNPESIPHDLWRAAEWPATTFPERMTLLLSGFHLTYQLNPDDRSVTLRPYPRTASIQHRYALNSPADAQRIATEFAAAFPQAIVRAEGDGLFVQSTIEDHWQIARRLGGTSADEQAAGNGPDSDTPQELRRYSLKLESQPLGAVLRVLEDRLRIEFRHDATLDAALQQRVSLEVTEVDAEHLVAAALDAAGLQGHWEGNVVTVSYK